VSDSPVDDDGLVPYGATARHPRPLMGRSAMSCSPTPSVARISPCARGEVVQLLLTNAANARVFNLSFPGARMKVIAGDAGPVRARRSGSSVVIAPAERYVVQVRFDTAWSRPPSSTTCKGSTTSLAASCLHRHARRRRCAIAPRAPCRDFDVLHANPRAIADIERYSRYFSRPQTGRCCSLSRPRPPFVTSPSCDSTRRTSPRRMGREHAKHELGLDERSDPRVLRDPATGKENMDIG